MKTVQSIEEFKEVAGAGKTFAVFSADWCPDCVFIKPFLPELEQEFSEFTFVYVDRDELIELCQELDIFGIPSFVAFQDGKEIGRYVDKDRKTKEQISSFINNLPVHANE
ncbi:thioredoxin family protein [Fictibacillus fluitans]|uniref:Thioredoxin family protein n=1 Tax=Fictibacillus fluitans TaxID=3058422 RepID=A0ABT8I0M4_9BACL|nr:thioredoxin family protein [Fictibacillus sp. NE201]MDN4526573.1 thioredoxin family protein [Fictibacillus sp. NE201]